MQILLWLAVKRPEWHPIVCWNVCAYDLHPVLLHWKPTRKTRDTDKNLFYSITTCHTSTHKTNLPLKLGHTTHIRHTRAGPAEKCVWGVAKSMSYFTKVCQMLSLGEKSGLHSKDECEEEKGKALTIKQKNTLNWNPWGWSTRRKEWSKKELCNWAGKKQ